MVKEFLENYLNASGKLTSLTIELNTTCNLKCCHCYVTNRNKTEKQYILSLDLVKKILNEAKEIGVFKISFTGGEPLLHPNIFEILEMAKNMSFFVFLKTNATLIDDNNINKIKSNVDFVITSRYGYSEQTYDKITGIQGSFLKYLKALSLLKKNSIPYKENGILLRENEIEIDRFLQSQMQIEKYISFNFKNNYVELHKPSDGVLKKCYTKILEKYNHSNNKFSMEKGVCNCGKCALTINAMGEVNPCTNFYYSLGSILDNNLNEIWESPKIKELIEKCKFKYFNKCNNCDNKKYLLSVSPCINFTETENINDVSYEMCRHCNIVKEIMNEI